MRLTIFYTEQKPSIVNFLKSYFKVFDENKQSFCFVTERVVCSLADLLNRFSNVPGGYASVSKYLDDNGTISELEISRGLINIVEGLQYLHHVQRKLHASIAPENIIIIPGGSWKLCGLGHSLSFSGEEFKVPSPYYISPLASANLIRLEPGNHFEASIYSILSSIICFVSCNRFALCRTRNDRWRI
jgi:serine/threonine protein kinase